jgi:hypothetical protein
LALRGRSCADSTALRTSWSLSTLQEQTIINPAGPSGDALKRDPFDIEVFRRLQKEKRRFEAIPN